MDRHLDIKGISVEIEKILMPYVRTKSFTNTVGEKEAEFFFQFNFEKEAYFQKNKEYYGTFPIKDDPLNRSVSWALIRGKGPDTVVLIHHNDIVSVEDFRSYKEYAFSPYELERKLRCISASLPADVSNDLESGDYMFGRGVCDMKGGGAIQIALMNYYSRISDLKGNLVLLALPDEENLSAGMRSGVILLKRLQNKYNLNYRLMINSEPHQRKQKDTGVFSVGSIGKIMPFVYVRGYLAHAGKVFEGLNPLNVMSGIVRATELNSDFSDTVFSGEASPPPTWLYFKDSKEHYDVSMPLFAYGCISVQTMKQTPKEVLNKIKNIAEDVFKQVLKDTQKSSDVFCKVTGTPQHMLPWSVKVISIGELLKDIQQNLGNEFDNSYNKIMNNLFSEVKTGKISLIAANQVLVNWLFDNLEDTSPCVVYGLIPPYVPHVSNDSFSVLHDNIKALPDKLNAFTLDEFGQRYTTEHFYTGISDLSYSSMFNRREVEATLKESMPFWGRLYDLPIDTIEQISMPCINIGPWGKDFHKMTERVLKEDLYVRTPRIIAEAIRLAISSS